MKIEVDRKYLTYADMELDALSCVRCELCDTRKNVVLCDGTLDAKVMVIGEAPGASEDEQGKPFVGRSGQLLIKLFSQIGINREEIYIANVLKCRPPENRDPSRIEISQCSPFLQAQINFVSPKVIVPVGNFASKYILSTKEGITKIRGKKFKLHNSIVIPTVHPAYVLRNGKKAQDDMLSDLLNVSKELRDS